MKAHRSEEVDPRNFLLLEELDLTGETYTTASKKRDSEKLFRRLMYRILVWLFNKIQ